MRRIYFLIYVGACLSVLLASCSSSVRSRLEEAQQFMIDNPDSALKIVNSIDPSSLKTDEEEALYALRMAQARYYNDDPEWGNDYYLPKSLAYYSRNFNNPDAAMAYYLAGIRNMELDNTNIAIENLTESAIAAERHKDWLRVSLANQNLAQIYYYKGRYASSLFHARKGYEYSVINESAAREEYLEDAEKTLVCLTYAI